MLKLNFIASNKHLGDMKALNQIKALLIRNKETKNRSGQKRNKWDLTELRGKKQKRTRKSYQK